MLPVGRVRTASAASDPVGPSRSAEPSASDRSSTSRRRVIALQEGSFGSGVKSLPPLLPPVADDHGDAEPARCDGERDLGVIVCDRARDEETVAHRGC